METLFVTLLYGTLLFSLLSGHSCFHCYAIGLLHFYGNAIKDLICHIAPSLRLLVASSPQVRRQSVRMSHYHLRSKVALDLVDHVVDPGDVLVTFLLLSGRYGRTRSPSVTPVALGTYGVVLPKDRPQKVSKGSVLKIMPHKTLRTCSENYI
jgi:hypothetical protein